MNYPDASAASKSGDEAIDVSTQAAYMAYNLVTGGLNVALDASREKKDDSDERRYFYEHVHANTATASQSNTAELESTGKVKLLNTTSYFFPFIGKRVIGVPVPALVKYQPLVEREYMHAKKMDEIMLIDNRDDTTDVRFKEAVEKYEKEVIDKLEGDDLWIPIVPSRVTIGLPPRDRTYQLVVLTKIINGEYFSQKRKGEHQHEKGSDSDE
jgi:hypothetical protein